MSRLTARLNYKHTIAACYIGYLTQALVINFSPLLFVTFQDIYGLSLTQVSTLIAISFTTQLIVDGLASRFVDKISYRISVVGAHLFALCGMVGLALLPELLTPMPGLIVATVLGSIGGGLTEVMISPLLEACPTDGKSGAMSLLHSFYCWGQVATVALSTLFFATVGIEHWRLLACLWAILPAVGALVFAVVPLYRLDDTPEQAEKGVGTAAARRDRRVLFLLFFALMICAGAAEQAMSQWASTFVERALGMQKTVGDLLGPCLFATLMGTSRVLYTVLQKKWRLERFMLASCVLCVVAYLLAALSPSPAFSLLGCGLCGLSVGILWPGTYSRAAVDLRGGGMSLFALLALGGDIGCLIGPSAAGQVAARCGDNLRAAFLFSLVFPVTAIVLFLWLFRKAKKQNVRRADV